MGNMDRYSTYKGGKVMEVVEYANYIGLRRFYRYVVNIGRWSRYEGGQLDIFHSTLQSTLPCIWLALAISTRTDLPSVHIMHHVKQVQYMEPQEDHIFSCAIISITIQL